MESYVYCVKRGDDRGTIDVKIYCKLGHLHLLLENYAVGKQTSFSRTTRN